jgi:hypothetical protein
MNEVHGLRTVEPPPPSPAELLREKILYVLRLYPRISPSMLQTGLGNVRPADWRPVLEKLIKEGHINRETKVSHTPEGHRHTPTFLYLDKYL